MTSCMMISTTIGLGVIGILMILGIIFLKRFMCDMAMVEAELIKELKDIKGVLIKISEKQL